MDTTPEELAAEQAAAQAPKEEEIRSAVIAEYGFDETADAERIDKLVTKEMDSHKKLSNAIGQKIKYRTDAEELRKKVAPPPTPANTGVSAEDIDKKLDEKLTQRLEKEALDSMDYPADIKASIQKLAQIDGISVKQAARDPMIVSKIEAYQKEEKAEAASISRTNRSGSKKTYSFDSPPDVDMSTEEGRKEWAEYKREMIKQGN